MPRGKRNPVGRPPNELALRSDHPDRAVPGPLDPELIHMLDQVMPIVRQMQAAYGWLTCDKVAARSYLLNRFAQLSLSSNQIVATRASELLAKHYRLFDEADKELPASPDGAVQEILARVRGILLSPAVEPVAGNGHQAGELPVIDVRPDVVDNKG